MSKQPLFPHISQKKEVQFPHVPKSQLGRLPQTTKRYEFFPEKVRKLLPPIGSTGEDRNPMVWVKFFTPWANWTWYGIEFDGKDIFFGWVVGLEKEFGSFSLSELQSLGGPGGLKIERDIYFEPKPISQVMREYGESLALPQIELLASTEGDPIRKFCCRLCGECAPPELLEEGRFPDRIAWLRHHYKEKHPGVWGGSAASDYDKELEQLRRDLHDKAISEEAYKKAVKEILERKHRARTILPQTVEGGEPIPPEYRHLIGWINEPLPREAE